jgi:cleavage and polyadenylation specificity factor subunit 1
MSQFEQILSLKVVELASKENTSGKKLFVAVGTGFMRSEDLSCRGRVSLGYVYSYLLAFGV